jgi:hypothetical protein
MSSRNAAASFQSTVALLFPSRNHPEWTIDLRVRIIRQRKKPEIPIVSGQIPANLQRLSR